MADGRRLAEQDEARPAGRSTVEGAKPASMLGAATAAIGPRALQRKLSRRRADGPSQQKVSEGWGGKGLNAGPHTIGPNGERDPASDGVDRLPLDGLPTADFPHGKAIVVVPSQVKSPDAKSIDLLVHFHGWGPGFHGARDVTHDNIEQQLAAAGRPMIAVLPQLASGPGVSAGSPGQEQAFDPVRIAKAVFDHLRGRTPPLLRADQEMGRAIASGHSAGGRAATKTAAADAKARPDAAGGLFLFDGHVNFDKVSALLTERLTHDRGQMVGGDPAHPVMTPAQQLSYVETRGFVFRAFGEGGGYTGRHDNPKVPHGSAHEGDYQGGGHGGPEGTAGQYGGRTQRLADFLDEWFADAKHTGGVGPTALTRWRQNYKATAHDGGDAKGKKPEHETMVSHGDGATDGGYQTSNTKTGRQGHLEQAIRGMP